MQQQPEPRGDSRHSSPAGTGGPAGGAALPELAQQAAALVAASQEIIDAALSGDSQAFLRATRQAGGQ
jgi:hypothetical protein